MRITRRQFGQGALATGALGAVGAMAGNPAEAAAGRPAPSTAVFPNACDCHVHIIGPQSKYKMAEGRAYTPPEASVAQLQAFHKRLGIARTVLVQPSFYGTDNSCMLDSLAQLGASARAVAVVDATIPDAQLKAMDAKGVRGIRINLETAGKRDPKQAAALLKAYDQRTAPLGWHIQIFTVLSVIDGLVNTIADMKSPVVIDHMGMPEIGTGGYPKGFSAMLDLAQARKIYVKLSGLYRFSKAKDYSDVTPYAQSIIYARRDHMLWGSDWPHTQQIKGHSSTEPTPFYKIDDAAVMRLFNSWYPDEETRKMILVDNPAKLYRF